MTQQDKRGGEAAQSTPPPQGSVQESLAPLNQAVQEAQAAGLDFGFVFKVVGVLQKHSGLLVQIGNLVSDLAGAVASAPQQQKGKQP